MEVYIILAKTVGTDLYKNKVSIIFADRFFFNLEKILKSHDVKKEYFDW